MPWKEIKPMNEKIKMIAESQTKNMSITDIADKYGISRKTVYKWLYRYEEEGIDGLKDKGRAPHTNPNETPDKIVKLLIKEKLKNRKRGPKKVYAQLKGKYPQLNIPQPSTIGNWFKKNGLVKPRKRAKRVPPYEQPFMNCQASNDVWSADFKGQFYTKNAKVCYPLTISDNYSRYLIQCKGLIGPRTKQTIEIFRNAFKEYGMPYAIRTDNGVPFAGKCVGGLSRLSVWFIQLGIMPERIEKGRPDQNGRHERMHRTLKEETLDPVAVNMKEQQKQFDIFRVDYNNYRPHEALGQQAPSKYYRKSNRVYVEKPHKPEYDYTYTVRRVRMKGEITIGGKDYFISELLIDEPVGLKEIDDGIMMIYYSFYKMGLIDMRRGKVIKKVSPMSMV